MTDRVRDAIADAEGRMKRSPAIDHWPADRERREAEALLRKVLRLSEDDELDRRAAVPVAARRRFDELVRRRAGGEPMAHILGWTEFRGLRMNVRPGAFVPRQSSEFLVEQAVKRLRSRRAPVSVDLATGIGPTALAIAAEVPKAEVHGSDLLAEGLRQARANAKALGITNASFHRGDMFGALPSSLRGRVDVLTVHPPYVPRHEVGDLPLEVRGFEPESTLTDYSDDGMALATRAAVEGRDWLRRGGWLLEEVSPDRTREVRTVMRRAGFRDIRSTNGWPGINRVVLGRT